MRSKEIADLAGVTVRTLRHYRKIGLLREPERAENGYCEYTVNDLVRLLRIKTLSSLGFSLVDIAHMLDADDAAQGGSAYDDKLDELDRELASQIERPQEQRRTVARLKAEGISPDMPLRAGRVIGKLTNADLFPSMEEVDKTSLLLAAHLYAEEDFEEIDNFCTALIERDLVEDYQRASALLEDLDETSTEAARDHAAREMIALLTEVIDCFDAKNWDRPATTAEKIIDEYGQEALNPVQEAVSNRILEDVYEQIVKRSPSKH